MIIYKMENKLNGKIYVGQTIRTLQERISEHIRKNNGYIDKAIKKYGIDSFDIIEIDKADNIEELNEKEIYWIKYYNCIKPKGYNLCEGGGNTKGYHHSKESRIKMSLVQKKNGSQLGKKNHFYGKTHSEEQKEKWSLERKGAKHTAETRQKMRLNRNDARAVLNLTTGEIFESISLAADKYNLKSTHISRVCKGKRISTGGYRWEYVKD